MYVLATQLRPGMVVKHGSDLHTVFSVEHRTPGNKRGLVQAKLRNLRSGAMIDHRFRAEDDVEKVVLDEVEMEYLYQDGSGYCFMNTENYEQVHLTREVLGDTVDYLVSNLTLKVVETEPGLKSATASSVMKQARLETGLVVLVPPFIGEGESIRVDTAEGVYLERVK